MAAFRSFVFAYVCAQHCPIRPYRNTKNRNVRISMQKRWEKRITIKRHLGVKSDTKSNLFVWFGKKWQYCCMALDKQIIFFFNNFAGHIFPTDRRWALWCLVFLSLPIDEFEQKKNKKKQKREKKCLPVGWTAFIYYTTFFFGSNFLYFLCVSARDLCVGYFNEISKIINRCTSTIRAKRNG